MANLRQDILNNLGNEKYYTELELIRQAQDPNMVYESKVVEMSEMLKSIASIDLAIQLMGKYFPEEAPAAATPAETPQAQPQPQVHAGQTHGE